MRKYIAPKGNAMQYFPVFLNLKGTCCLVVGGGEVGCRKIADLLASDVSSIVVFEIGTPSSCLLALAADDRVVLKNKYFEAQDALGMRLVFAATDDQILNATIRDACKEYGILCDAASDPQDNDFILPARIEEGMINVAISTQGASPALAKKLKSECSGIVSRYAPLAEILRRIRPMVLQCPSVSSTHARLFRALVESDLGRYLNDRDKNACEKLLRLMLPEALHGCIKEILYGFI